MLCDNLWYFAILCDDLWWFCDILRWFYKPSQSSQIIANHRKSSQIITIIAICDHCADLRLRLFCDEICIAIASQLHRNYIAITSQPAQMIAIVANHRKWDKIIANERKYHKSSQILRCICVILRCICVSLWWFAFICDWFAIDLWIICDYLRLRLFALYIANTSQKYRNYIAISAIHHNYIAITSQLHRNQRKSSQKNAQFCLAEYFTFAPFSFQ